MASDFRRILPVVIGVLVLGLLGLGCLERATMKPSSEATLSKQAIVALATQSLTSSGMSEPPLRKEATRADRKDYLAAMQGVLDQLRKLGAAKSEGRPKSSKLLLDEQSEQVLAVSRLLAVELADAIDRSDTPRAISALRLAADYSAFISERSVPDWLTSSAIADTLAVGVKSVSDQMDTEMADALVAELARMEVDKRDPAPILAADANRLGAWLSAAEATKEPLSAERIAMIIGDARTGRSVAFSQAIEAIAPSGYVPPEVFVAECRIAIESVTAYLREPRGPLPTVDSSRHPISAYLLSILRPTFSEAARLDRLRAENSRILALTIKVAAADVPEDLSAMGELAISPVSSLPFEYVRREEGFDLARPRAKAEPTS